MTQQQNIDPFQQELILTQKSLAQNMNQTPILTIVAFLLIKQYFLVTIVLMVIFMLHFHLCFILLVISKNDINIVNKHITTQTMQLFTKLKDQGNQLFKDKKYQEAIATFQSALDLITKEHSLDNISKDSDAGKLYIILNINAAFAGLSLKTNENYRQAEKFCDSALKIDPKNHKGLYRRALANKELAELIEIESKGSSEELIGLYNKAKKDLEDLCVEDRTNQIAKQKLSEVIKNIYRVTVTQGKEVNLSSGTKIEEVKGQNQTLGEKVEATKARKATIDMNKILKDYKVEEVTMIARGKIEQHYLTQPLPKNKAELEKGIREIEKSKDVFLKFIYRLDNDYLVKIQPGFEMLFKFIGAILEQGEGIEAKMALQAMRNQKGFELLWMGYTAGEKEIYRNKCTDLGVNISGLK